LIWDAGVEGYSDNRQMRCLSPVAHAASVLAQIAGGVVLPCQSSNPGRAVAVGSKTAAGHMAIVANLASSPTEVELAGLEGSGNWKMGVLDSATWESAASCGPSRHQEPWRNNMVILDSFAVAVFRDW
jgi:hypothetical protein